MSKTSKSIKKICVLGLLTAILIVLSLVTSLIPMQKVTLQLTTGIYMAFVCFIPGMGMMLVGIIYGVILDAIAGSLITIPITLLINVIIFGLIKCGITTKLYHLFFVLAASTIVLYLPYQWFVGWNGLSIETKKANLLIEIIVDSCQFIISIIVCEIIYFAIIRTKLNIKLKEQYLI